MSNVTIGIAGRRFTVACAEGEEAHIAMLGRTIDGKVADMPHIANQSEARTLLYAALLLADENHELQQGGGGSAGVAPEVVQSLEALAGQLERVASQLEGSG
jgi:cell division protein ZapA